ncbi:hypothetical protein [Desulfobacca acetoxidans]|uniref:DNA polymerase III subunit alpha n=1 Tax=Desulfobacca acetoxidans (strain ATCC 700848 / DSM 11109 / ASRB2) TaxID=880072 RepID=F2NG15_DESAR|nr:hypothetical protein [Desulfobacca acetoxidans]AEB08428.1 DNA polymerase III subunit alpha [Desulfobacca acetoxidans DSM 11109]
MEEVKEYLYHAERILYGSYGAGALCLADVIEILMLLPEGEKREFEVVVKRYHNTACAIKYRREKENRLALNRRKRKKKLVLINGRCK